MSFALVFSALGGQWLRSEHGGNFQAVFLTSRIENDQLELLLACANTWKRGMSTGENAESRHSPLEQTHPNNIHEEHTNPLQLPADG
jgi:hypothetical protein